ncbi:MAG: glycine zipper 2TM domain-containing protein [Pseudomonadota bacterium]
MNLATRLAGLLSGAMLLTALTACNESGAKVLEAKAITQVVRTPREECSDKTVTQQKPVKDDNRVLGTIAGAVVGGVVGREVGGKGTSKDVGTVAGAAAGGYAGNRIQKSVQKNATEQTTQHVCETVYDSRTEETGSYKVRYQLNGKEGTVTMDHNPGSSIPVKDGKLEL